MVDLQEETASLRLLEHRKATPERRKRLTEALNSKFEGLQSVALHVLGAWGDTDSIAAIRRFLEVAFARPVGWSVRRAAIKALIAAGEKDAVWALNLYFKLPGVLEKHEMFPLVLVLPPDAARKRLIRELRNADWMNRQAAVKAIGSMAFPDKLQLLTPLCDDPNQEVAGSARALTNIR